MDALKELIEVVSAKRLKSAGKPEFPDARMGRLYHAVANGTITDDAAALAAFFPDAKSIVPYQRLKLGLKKHLYRMLFLVDLNQPNYQLRQQAYFECHRNWGVIKMLVGKNAKASTLELASELLQMSRKYDFIEIALDVARILRLQYGSILGDLKRYDQYGAMAAHLEAVVQAENKAEALYTDLVVRFVNNKSAKQDVHKQALEFYRQVETSLDAYDTYRLHLCGRLIEVIIYSSINDYKNTVTVCDRAIRFFEARPYIANVPLQAFYHQAMVCYIQLRDYEKGRVVAAKGMQLLEEGTFNWFKYQELLLILALHTKAYQEAYRVFKAAVQHRKFGALPAHAQQIWKINEAYLYYLMELGLIKKMPEAQGDQLMSRFRMSRFVNETPLYSKDKRGLNIPILIFQILHLIREKRYNETIDRMEAIEKYTTRYLVKDDTFRSNCFIKMLLTMPASGFHRVATIRHAEKFVKLLREAPLDFANQSHEVELIPYSDLWEMALGTLE